MWFYIIKNGQKTGPFSVEELRVRIANGSAKKTDLVWREGESDYLPVAAILSATKSDAEGVSAARASLEHPSDLVTGRSKATASSEAAKSSACRAKLPSEIGREFSHLRDLPLKTVFPLGELLRGRLWHQFGVVWVLVLASIPLGISCLSKQSEREGLLWIDSYFALIIALAFFFYIRPDSISIQRIGIFTSIPFTLVVGEQALFSLIKSSGGIVDFAILLAKLLLANMLISLPFSLYYIGQRRVDSFRSIVYCGCLAGLAYGLMPLCFHAPSETYSSDAGYTFAIIWKNLASLLLCSSNTGILACFIAFAAQNRRFSASLTTVGVVSVTALSTLSVYAVGTVFGFAVAGVSILLLTAYIQNSAEIQKQLDAMPAGQAPLL